MNYKKGLQLLSVLVFISLLSTGCGEIIVTPQPIADNEIVVATYNILNGAGVDPLVFDNRKWVEEYGYPGNRLEQVLDVIEYINPDILGIQEAHQWELGDPAVVKQVADRLGMNYFFGQSNDPDAGYCSAVLFTRFEIIESENYPDHFTRAGLRVKLKTPEGTIINVFVAHLDSNHQERRLKEAAFIVTEMAPYLDEYSMIMGDMNFFDPSPEAEVFHSAGWAHPVAVLQGIDQIWTTPDMESGVRKWGNISVKMTEIASDHIPSVIVIDLPD